MDVSQFDKSQIVQKLQSGRMKKSMINEKGIISRSGKGKVGENESLENPERSGSEIRGTDSKGECHRIEKVLKEEQSFHFSCSVKSS